MQTITWRSILPALLLMAVASSDKNSGTIESPEVDRDKTLVNINELAMWIEADGKSASDPHRRDDGIGGLSFPRGNDPPTTVVFQDGFVWGGQVYDGAEPLVRVGGQTFSIGTTPGIINDNLEPGLVDRVWRVRRDYFAADLSRDASEIGMTEAEVRQQYAEDWQSWPADKGAPFYDADNDGIYTPQFHEDGSPVLYPEADEPGLGDADQVVWLVANDLDAETVGSMYGSPPIGLEMQLTLWAYTDEPLDNVIFKRYRVIYKGTSTTPPTAHIDSMYISQWSDTDLGAAGDDFVGCDTTLDLGYTYNFRAFDYIYNMSNLLPPAMGYDILQGPVVPSPGDTSIYDFGELSDFRNLPMTSYAGLGAGGADSDPIRGGDYNGTLQWYNMMRGYRPRPEFPPEPWINPITGQVTMFRLPGDPVSGTGWIDNNPGSRRMYLMSGPFSMALGDTQEVVIAVLADFGPSHILAIESLKDLSRKTQALYDNQFEPVFVDAQVSTDYRSVSETFLQFEVTTSGSANHVTGTITNAKNDTLQALEFFDDGTHGDRIAGDHVFSNFTLLTPVDQPLHLNLVIKTPMRTFEIPKVRRLTTAGPVSFAGYEVASDNLNSDGFLNPGENVRITTSLRNGSAFDLGRILLAYESTGPILYRDDFEQIFQRVDSLSTAPGNYDPGNPDSYVAFQIDPNAEAGDTVRFALTYRNDKGNLWQDAFHLPIEPFEDEPSREMPAEHVAGFSDGHFSLRFIEPQMLTQHDYEIHIELTDSIAGDLEGARMNLIDIVEQDTVLHRHALPDEFSHNMPVVDGFKLFGSEFSLGRPKTYASEEHAIDVDPTDPGLDLWFDGTAFSPSGDLAAVIGGAFPPARLAFLVQDIELRFTGVPAGGATVDTQNDTVIVDGGQWATQWDREAGKTPASLDGLQWVPLRLPFELWDIENNRQVNCIVINRNADGNSPYGDGVGDPDTPGIEPRWRIAGRDYFIPHMSDYDETFAQNSPLRWDGDYQDGSPNSDFTTWFLFFHQGGEAGGGDTWTTGDVYRLTYVNPLTEADVWRFSTNVTSVDDDAGVVERFELFQNYPNPFNPATTIRYRIAAPGKVRLSIYNILGQEVARLVDKPQPVGEYALTWDGRDRFGRQVASGVYFYRIKTEGFDRVRKMLLVR